MDHPLSILPFVITVSDCFLPAMAPAVVETVAEMEVEITEILTGYAIARAYLEQSLN